MSLPTKGKIQNLLMIPKLAYKTQSTVAGKITIKDAVKLKKVIPIPLGPLIIPAATTNSCLIYQNGQIVFAHRHYGCSRLLCHCWFG